MQRRHRGIKAAGRSVGAWPGGPGGVPVDGPDADVRGDADQARAPHRAAGGVAEAYAAGGRPAPAYADPTVTAGATAIKAAYLMELRAARAALEALQGSTKELLMVSRQLATAVTALVLGSSSAQAQSSPRITTQPGLGLFDYVLAVADFDGDGLDNLLVGGREGYVVGPTPEERFVKSPLHLFASVGDGSFRHVPELVDGTIEALPGRGRGRLQR